MPPDLGVRKTRTGFWVVPIHYSMHPERDEEWVKELRASYPPDTWEREMEIDFSKTSEKRVFKFFDTTVHGRKLKWVKDLPILRGWDFGYDTAAAVMAQWLPQTDQFAILGEVIVRNSTIFDFKPAVIEYCRKRFPEAFYQDYADISGTYSSERAEKTSVEILNDGNVGFEEVYPMTRKADVIRGLTQIRELMNLRADGNPGLIIDIDECPVLTRGFKGEYVLDKKDKPKVDQHPVDDPQDALRYIVENYIQGARAVADPETEEEEDRLARGFAKTSTVTGYWR